MMNLLHPKRRGYQSCLAQASLRRASVKAVSSLLFMLQSLSVLLAQEAFTPSVATQELNAMSMEVLFERNLGQLDAQVHFVARDRQATYFFMNDEVRSVVSADSSQFAYSMKFVGGQAGSRPVGIGNSKQRGQNHVLEGSNFISNVPQHEQLRYPNMWDNIHVYFGQSQEGLKYETRRYEDNTAVLSWRG